jgi:hypothetical protein
VHKLKILKIENKGGLNTIPLVANILFKEKQSFLRYGNLILGDDFVLMGKGVRYVDAIGGREKQNDERTSRLRPYVLSRWDGGEIDVVAVKPWRRCRKEGGRVAV